MNRWFVNAMICSTFLFSSCWGEDYFAFDPPKTFVLDPHYIGLHHPVETNSVTAQLYFDQGLSFIYAFNHEAAYWSFLKASQVDPNMAMAYWGMALSLGMNINTPITEERSKVANAASRKAVQLAKNGIEKKYAEAIAKRYSEDPKADQEKLALEYSQEMKNLISQYPDDLDGAALYAESLLDLNPWNQWTLDGKPLPGTMEAVKTLESIMKRDPNHLGANHYFIHAVEASPHPEIALMSAERLKTLLPSSGHLVHMSSHIYLLVGDYHQAAVSNEAGIAADREYIRKYGMYGTYPIHYMSHNYYLMTRAYTMEGRFEDAKKAADQLASLYTPYYEMMPDLEYYASSPLTVLITFEHWNDILEMKEPSKKMEVYTSLWHFGRGLAFEKKGELEQAKQEQKLFEESRKNISHEKAFGYNSAAQILDIADACLKAQLSESQGDSKQAIAHLNKAIQIQDSLHYNEPPDWFYPVRETLGNLLLKIGNYPEAEKVFRADISRHPRNGRSLFGLFESVKKQGKTDSAYWINAEFQKAWMYSNISLQNE